MSEREIEAVRRGFAAMNEGVDAALPLIDPEFEMVTTARYAAEPDTYHGREGVRRWFAGFEGIMDEVRLEPHTVEGAGDGRVIVEFTLSARGLSSGLEAGQRAVALVTLSGERFRRIEFHEDLASARAAAR